MKKIMLIVLLITTPMVSNAESDTKRETVDKLLIAMNMDGMVDDMFSQVEKSLLGMRKDLGVKESEQQIFENYIAKVTSAMKEEMTWERMKGPMIDVYLKHYSQKELDDMLAFYDSETGKSIINKMPAIMAESVPVTQDMHNKFMSRLNVLSKDLRKELKQARARRE